MESIRKIKRFWYQQIFVEINYNLSVFNRLILFLIFFGIVISIISTESSFEENHIEIINMIELSITFIFAFEYLLRLWVIGENSTYQGLLGRLKYIKSPLAIIDLMAFLPLLLTFGSMNTFLLRIIRLVRLIRFLTMGKYNQSLQIICMAISKCWRELIISYLIALKLIFISASILYFIESDLQPDAFGSIPRALWWSMATLTTIGYGDVFPITIIGKAATGLIALTGIGLVGLPTAILAGAFSDEYKSRKNKDCY